MYVCFLALTGDVVSLTGGVNRQTALPLHSKWHVYQAVMSTICN